MFLKRLELSGFKSFPAKTALEFPFGVIAIVGPNGSGKSNLADALRWVMGEQSMLKLRSKKGEDLIFNGTVSKARMGKGEATLFFDNKDKIFPFEFDEVSIGRKVYRDGLNQYFINGSEVRLKDVAEVIAKAKLGLKGYTIINQGMGDLILNSTPLERREIFEEALGLKEYQLKKKDALEKLSQTSVNLATAKKLIEEIEPHLRFLKKQVAKLEKREEIAVQLKELEQKYFVSSWSAVQTERNQVQSEIKDVESKIKQSQSEFDALDKQIASQEKEAGSFLDSFQSEEKTIGELETQRSVLLKELGKLEGLMEAGIKQHKAHHVPASRFIEFLRELESDLSELLASVIEPEKIKSIIEAQISKIQSLLKEAVQPLETSAEKTSLEDKKNEVLAKVKAIDGQISGLRQKISSLTAQNHKQRQEFSQLHQQLRSKEHEISQLQNHRQRLDLRFQQAIAKEGELKEFFGSSFEEFKASSPSLSTSQVDSPGMRHEIERLRVRLELATEVDPETLKEYEATNQRYEFLTSQISDLEQSMINLQSVIKDLEEHINQIFDSAFDKINESFNHYFKLLFGGGKAGLSLIKAESIKRTPHQNKFGAGQEAESIEEEEYENPEAGGIDVKVDPPGKKIKGLSALSGGERALTSIALLFALVSTSPPPFMVLDEVDAPLDESNSLRFVKILQELKKNTQFVIVTHNREVMREADVLYGVTMEEEGISKLLSLQLQTAEQYGQ